MEASQATTLAPCIVPRSGHGISRAHISENALKVLYRLRQAGYQAYLVGGGVRDLLLGREPKDFDVATDARPEQVREVFRNCRLIGRRFRLAHVHFGREIIEVATFRGSGAEGERETANGMLLSDNLYGTLEEDAVRRDFTVNALYYRIDDFSLVDYVGGKADLEQGLLRLIGDPEARYREDPVRMLRAVRFAAKLGFNLDPATESPLWRLGSLLRGVPPARLFEEMLKLFLGGAALSTFEKLRHYGLFAQLFADTEGALSHQEEGFPITFVSRGMANTDQRIEESKPVTPTFLLALLLWEPVRLRYLEWTSAGKASAEAMLFAASEVSVRQQSVMALPKRFSLPMREIWHLQPRFEQRNGRRAARLLAHPRFRAAYDFYLLRAESGEVDPAGADWWTRIQEVDPKDRHRMTEADKGPRVRRRRRRAGPAESVAADAP